MEKERRKEEYFVNHKNREEKPKLPDGSIELGSVGWEALTLVTEPRTSL